MKEKSDYVPPAYVPLDQSNEEDGLVPEDTRDASRLQIRHDQTQWSSGICACCDNMQSCCVGLICPCFLFGKNAEFLGAGTWMGPCIVHFIICGLGCMLTDGLLLGLPGSVAACYACNYRRALRTKYNLQVVVLYEDIIVRKLLVETLQLMSAVTCVPYAKSTEKFVKGLAILLMALKQFLLLLPLQFRTWNQHPSSHNLYMADRVIGNQYLPQNASS